MKLDPDMVPISFDEAVDEVVKGLTLKEVEDAISCDSQIWGIKVHGTFGEQIRNDFELWQRSTALNIDVWDRWQVWHADDISAIILYAVWCKLRKQNFEPTFLIKRFQEHWEKIGQEPVSPL